MGTKFWKVFDYIVGMLPIGALFGLLVYTAGIEIKDLDLWLHLAMGKFITLHHYVPDVDMLSNSIAGKPWGNHEWLFQVIVYNIYNIWGPDGLSQMQTAIVLVTMLILLFLGYNREKQLTIAFSLFLVFLVYQQRFTIRPDIFSLLFFALYIFVLALHIDKRWSVLFLFFIQVLWSNIHGFFFFGPLFALIGLLSEWIKRHVRLPYEWNESGRLTDEEYKRLGAIFIFVCAACFINPGFAKGAFYPIGVFFGMSGDNKIFFKYIQELQPPITRDTIFDTSHFIYYKLMILLSFVSFFFNRRRIDISALFLWIVFLIFSLKAIRNNTFFAFAAYLVIITNVVNLSYKNLVPLRFTQKKFKYLTFAVIKLLFLIWIFQFTNGITLRGYYDFDKYERKSEFGGIAQRSFPNKAADFLVNNNIKGNFFNDFNSGAYLLGRCFPNIKVFIDGRTEVYGADFFINYKKIWGEGDSKRFEEVEAKYGLTGAFLNSVRQHIPDEILKYLYERKDWKVVYFDYDAVIFLKDVPENKQWIDEHEIDLSKWKAKKLDYYRLGSAHVDPYQAYFRAYTLQSLGLYDQALDEAKEALKVSPVYTKPYELIGKIYAEKENFEEAFHYFRIATVQSGARDVRYNFARSYYDLGQYEGAAKQYNKILALWPNDARAMFFLSKTYAKNKQYDSALKTISDASDIHTYQAQDIIDVGDILFEQEQYELAKDVYAIAIKEDEKEAAAYQKLGEAYTKLDKADEAKKFFEQAQQMKLELESGKEEVE